MSRFVKLFASTAVSAIVVGAYAVSPASAEDRTASPWEGFYFGVTGGYATGDADVNGSLRQNHLNPASQLVSEDGKADLDGGMVGGLVGYDYSVGNGIVIGVVGDLSWMGISGDADVDPAVILSGTDYTVDASVDWLGTIRGRVGFELGDALIYGTGGLAFGGVDTDLHVAGGGNIGSDSGTQFGWTVGAGINYMATERIMLGAEYLYVDLGEQSYDFQRFGDADIDLNMHIIRGTLSFRF